MLPSNDFVYKYNLKKGATSNIKFQIILTSLSFSDLGIYLGDRPFSGDLGIVILHPSKGAQWVGYIKDSYFDSYGCGPPNKISRFIVKQNGHRL